MGFFLLLGKLIPMVLVLVLVIMALYGLGDWWISFWDSFWSLFLGNQAGESGAGGSANGVDFCAPLVNCSNAAHGSNKPLLPAQAAELMELRLACCYNTWNSSLDNWEIQNLENKHPREAVKLKLVCCAMGWHHSGYLCMWWWGKCGGF